MKTINRFTIGYFVERFDAKTGKFINKEFINSDGNEYEDENGNSLDFDELDVELTGGENDLLMLARSVIRDLCFNYPPEDCAEHPKMLVDKITATLGDSFNWDTSEITL